MRRPRVLTKADMLIARDVANMHGPQGDGELESAAMNGLLEAAGTLNGEGSQEASPSKAAGDAFWT